MNINFKLIITLLFICQNINSSVIFQKGDILITTLDIKIFDEFTIQNGNNILNLNQKIREIILINNIIKKVSSKNPQYLELIDEQIKNNNNLNTLTDFSFNLLRYNKIKQDLISDYYYNKISSEDIKLAFDTINNLKISLSIDNCNFIQTIKLLNEIDNFYLLFYDQIKNPEIKLTYFEANIEYEICLNQNNISSIEKALTKLIEPKINSFLRSYLNEK